MFTLNDLYLQGKSTSKFRFVINPLRYFVFRLMKPYFNALISEFSNSSHSFPAKRDIDRMALEIELIAIKNRLKAIESILCNKNILEE